MKKTMTTGLAAIALFAGSAFAQSPYTLRDLGTFGGTAAVVTGINDSGQMVVNATGFADGLSRCFLVDGTRTTALPKGAYGNGINSYGDIVGSYTSNGKTLAFVYRNRTMRMLGGAGVQRSAALAINDAGQIVGWAAPINGHTQNRAVIWENAGITELGPFEPNSLLAGDPSYATAINNSGLVAGYDLSDGFFPRGYSWDGIVHRMTPPSSLPPSAAGMTATGINRFGAVTGYTNLQGPCYAHQGFVAQDGVVSLLPQLSTSMMPSAINDAGAIAGTLTASASCTVSGPSFGFVLEGGGLSSLPLLMWGAGSEVLAMNNRGQVAGRAYPMTGGAHAAVWQKQQ